MRRRCCCSSPIITLGCFPVAGCLFPYQTTPQLLIDLPPITNSASGRFNTSGGEFIVDYSPTGETPEGNVFSANPGIPCNFPNCNFFGIVAGTECGINVRPFVSFFYPDGAGGCTLGVGYVLDVDRGPFGNTTLFAWRFRFPGGSGAFNCLDLYNADLSITGFITNSARNCDNITGFTQQTPDYLIRLRNA